MVDDQHIYRVVYDQHIHRVADEMGSISKEGVWGDADRVGTEGEVRKRVDE